MPLFAGKGSRRRPQLVDDQQFSANWEAAFGVKITPASALRPLFQREQGMQERLDKSAEYEAGWIAAAEDRYEAKNPFRIGSFEHRQWDDGHRDSMSFGIDSGH